MTGSEVLVGVARWDGTFTHHTRLRVLRVAINRLDPSWHFLRHRALSLCSKVHVGLVWTSTGYILRFPCTNVLNELLKIDSGDELESNTYSQLSTQS
jgi:hypothetical protein